MSITRAKNLLHGIRIHHLGFCFFWAVSFIVLSGLHARQDSGEYWRSYLVIEQVVTFLVVGSIACLYRKKRSVLPPWLSLLAAFMLSGGALLYFLGFFLGYGNLIIFLGAGLMMGCANALFFLLWQTFYVTEGQQRALIYIPLSAVFSIILYAATLFLPLSALIFVAVIVLPFLALFTLQASLSEVELFPIRIIDRAKARSLVGDLWRPVFCVCAIGFVWKLVAQLSGGAGDSSSFGALLILAGFGAAALFVVLIELFFSKGFGILRMYQILFPVLTGMFLLPTFFGSHYSPLLTGMLMFGFEVVNLLLLVTCAVYTAQKMYSPLFMYGVCIVPVLLAMSLGDIFGSFLSPLLAYDFAYIINALFVCIYLLSMVLLLVSRGKKTKLTTTPFKEELPFAETNKKQSRRRLNKVFAGDNKETEKAVDEAVRKKTSVEHVDAKQSPPDSVTALFFKDKSLSPREIEVAGLLIKGHSVSAISRKLFISENTTRGHTKSIYKKLDLHSRQELIDMCEVHLVKDA